MPKNPLKLPTHQKAPAGMTTDPETGEVKPSDETQGKEVISYKVTFPNMERQDYSTRPYFTRDWYRDLKTAVIRGGGRFVWDDPAQLFLSVNFRTAVAAYRFAQSLIKSYYVNPKQISSSVVLEDHKTAALPSPQELEQRVTEHANDLDLVSVLNDVYETYQAKNPNFMDEDPSGYGWVEKAAQDPELASVIHSELLRAERDRRQLDKADLGPASPQPNYKSKVLQFNPMKYVKRRASLIVAAFKAANDIKPGSNVLVKTPDGSVEAVVVSIDGPQATVQRLGDDVSTHTEQVQLSDLAKVAEITVPLPQVDVADIPIGYPLILSHKSVALHRRYGRDGMVQVQTQNGPSWVSKDLLTISLRLEVPRVEAQDWLSGLTG